MSRCRPGPWIVGTLLLALAAGVVLWAGSRRDPAAAARSAAAQRLLGGLGLGSASDLAACPAAFDPALAGRCAFAVEPAAGGAAWCPHHGGVSLRR